MGSKGIFRDQVATAGNRVYPSAGLSLVVNRHFSTIVVKLQFCIASHEVNKLMGKSLRNKSLKYHLPTNPEKWAKSWIKHLMWKREFVFVFLDSFPFVLPCGHAAHSSPAFAKIKGWNVEWSLASCWRAWERLVLYVYNIMSVYQVVYYYVSEICTDFVNSTVSSSQFSGIYSYSAVCSLRC